jgi:Cft2 family RNA processing exonuclease
LLNLKVLGAAREVGGSCISLETEQRKIALDYGIKLDRVTDEYPKNFDAIIVSHAHLDHTGSLVRLSKSRNNQRVFGSKMTRDVTVDLLRDMIKIQNIEGNSEVYDEQAADKVRDWWQAGENFQLPGLDVTLYSAGHVAGAKITGIHAEGKSILYTGDFCLHNTEILFGTNLNVLPKESDVLISESTYGGRVRPPRNEVVDQFMSRVAAAMKKNGNILVPTFAFHRSQEMARRIDQAIENGTLPKYNAYTISSLANKINAHFNANKQLFTPEVQAQEQPFTYKHIENLEKTTDVKEPAIVICTAGFGHAGASLNLLEQWAENEDDTVIITSGYLPADSPLRLAREKRAFRAADGEKISVAAKIVQIELSGHADQTELVQLVSYLRPKKTLLVHGDLPEAEALAEKISNQTDVCIPEKGESIKI